MAFRLVSRLTRVCLLLVGTVNMAWCGGKEGAECVCEGINCANQTDAYTLRGDPTGEVYVPTFTYHGFR